MKIKPGDVVRLKSGGPPMTAGSLEGDVVLCFWFSEAHNIGSAGVTLATAVHTKHFPLETLEKANEEATAKPGS